MIRRALELAVKDPYALWFRSQQSIKLHAWRQLGLWPRLECQVKAYWTIEQSERWLKSARHRPLIFPPRLAERLTAWSSASPVAACEAIARGDTVLGGSVSLFGSHYAVNWAQPPWNIDWRGGHVWTPKFYQDYRFYGADHGAEVKFPWELSRLGWLQPVALASMLDGQNRAEWIANRVSEWEASNPCAESVNWYPMECSMRSVNLCITLELLAAAPQTTGREVQPLLRVLALQAEFVARNIEYTEHRENHFAANIACLGLSGTLLKGYPGAERWATNAAHWLPKEILAQFLGDGMNFEKSLSYHRLTTELFVLLAHVGTRDGKALPSVARDRLHAAVTLLSCCRHPDGTAANFGDNDGARALALGGEPTARREATLALAAAFFRENALLAETAREFWAATFNLPLTPPADQKFVTGSAVGGFFTARDRGHALIADFGEVGLRGRGGHGHNDLFSFELSLHGRRIVVDAGCPIYTGSMEQYQIYRASAAHNGLTVDGEEIARLGGYWRIANDARPCGVEAHQTDEVLRICGQHSGYSRLADPVIHRRELRFDARVGSLSCTDRLFCRQEHDTIRRLHFAPGLDLALHSSHLSIAASGDVIAIAKWDQHTNAHLSSYHQSPEFGSLLQAQCLELHTLVGPSAVLEFQIRAS
jgi:uncharacterized heparinase superfamily protein